MIIPVPESEEIYRIAFSDWVTDSLGVGARYTFVSTIDEEAKISYSLHVAFKYPLFDRIFIRGLEKARCIARTTGDKSDFFDQFYDIRAGVWRVYGWEVPFTFLDPDEFGTIRFGRGLLGKLKLYLLRIWRWG